MLMELRPLELFFIIFFIRLFSAPDQPRSNADKLKIAHGILMVFAWCVFLATGILFARHFRDHWPDTKFIGVKMWFNVSAISLIFKIKTEANSASGEFSSFIYFFFAVPPHSEHDRHSCDDLRIRVHFRGQRLGVDWT